MNGRTARPPVVPTVIASMAVVAALYFARSILIPVALAGLIAVLLTPLAKRLEHTGLRPAWSSALATLTALVVVAVLGWVVTRQLQDLAERLPEYRSNMTQKVASIGSMGDSVGRLTTTLHKLGDEIVHAASRSTPDAPAVAARVTVVEPPATALQVLGGLFLPTLELLGFGVVVFVLTFFFLVSRRDLGDRLVHVFGRGSVHATSRTMAEAIANVIRYLLMQAAINACFGGVVTALLLVLGVPNAMLWGLFAAVLRFVPYVGVWLGLVPPLLLATAVYSSWTPAAVLLVAWVLLEVATANFVEPWIFGNTVAVSPLGILLGAFFWGWLWGPAGIVLAMPLTVSLFALARAVPRMGWMHTLFGSETTLEPRVQLYHRLLNLDSDSAADLVDSFARQRPLVEVCDELLLPTIALAELDRHRGNLEDDRAAALVGSIEAILEDLSSDEDAELDRRRGGALVPVVPDVAAIPVLVIPANDAADEIVASMLEACLSRSGYRVRSISARASSGEKAQFVFDHDDGIVCVSAVPPGGAAPARYLHRRIRARCPGARVVIGLWTAFDEIDAFKARADGDGGPRVVATLAEAVRQIRETAHAMRLQRAR